MLLEVLAEWLGDSFNREVENTWVMVSGFVIATIASGFTSALADIKAKQAELAQFNQVRCASNGSMEPPTPGSTAGSIRLPCDKASDAGSAQAGGSADFGTQSAHTPIASVRDSASGNDQFSMSEASKGNNYPPRLKILVDGSSGGCYGTLVAE